MTERPLRILMIVPLYPVPVRGGLERQAHELSKALAARGNIVTAISYRHSPAQAVTEMVEGIKVFRISRWPTRIWKAPLVPLQLISRIVVLRNNFDLIHVHTNSWFCVLGILTGILISKPTLFKLANVGKLGLPGMRNSFSGRLRLKIISRSSGIVAMNSDSLAELEDIHFSRKRTLFRPNGINLIAERHPVNRTSNVIRFVFVGRLSWEKRVDDLLVAWSRIADSSCRRELVLAGDGPDRGNLEALVAALGISDTVMFLGHVDDVSDILASSDVFVLPSELEGNSNSILEAMWAGLPILATDLAGSRIQLGDGAAEFLFPVGDVDRLVALMERMIARPTLRTKAGAAGKTRVKEAFEMVKVADDYEAAYRALCAGGDPNLATIGSFLPQPLDAC